MQPPQCLRQPSHALWIESRAGFVEKQNRRLVKQRACNGYALPHSARKRPHQGIAPLEQADIAQQQLGSFRRFRDFQQSRKQQQVLLGGKLVVNHRGVRHKACILRCRSWFRLRRRKCQLPH